MRLLTAQRPTFSSADADGTMFFFEDFLGGLAAAAALRAAMRIDFHLDVQAPDGTDCFFAVPLFESAGRLNVADEIHGRFA